MESSSINLWQVVFWPFGLFFQWPFLALIPSAGFFLAHWVWHARRPQACGYAGRVALFAAVGWLIYAVWEWYAQIQMPPESVPIRVDMLFIAPLLYALTIAGAVACWQLRQRAMRSGEMGAR